MVSTRATPLNFTSQPPMHKMKTGFRCRQKRRSSRSSDSCF